MARTPSAYLILVRHGERERTWSKDETEHHLTGVSAKGGFHTAPHALSVFDTEGLPHAYAMAGVLADELVRTRHVRGENVSVSRILHAPTTVARDTAVAFCNVLKARALFTESGEPLQEEALGPHHVERLSAWIGEVEQWARDVPAADSGQCIVAVGHEPVLGYIAARLASVPGGTLPLGRCEAALIRLSRRVLPPRRRVLSLITAKPAELAASLRAKIDSKLDIAKFLLGALVVQTGVLLNGEVWDLGRPLPQLAVVVGMSLLFLALALTASTLCAYDRLRMPTAFWSDLPRRSWGPRAPRRWSVARPPSQDVVVLYCEMVHTWQWLFIPAVSCALLGLLAVATGLGVEKLAPASTARFPSSVPPASAMAVMPEPSGPADGSWLVAFLTIGMALMAGAWAWYRHHRPRLGASD